MIKVKLQKTEINLAACLVLIIIMVEEWQQAYTKIAVVESMRGEITMRQKERETETNREKEEMRMGIAFYHQNIAPVLHFLQ